jgi:hypothetical protein
VAAGVHIIPRYGGTIIHDCRASYLSYTHCGHGLCGAHLLRELTFVVDSNGYPWAKNLKRLLKNTRAKVAERESKQLTAAEYKRLRKRYRAILAQGAKLLPPLPPRTTGSRGRVTKTSAVAMGGTPQSTHGYQALAFQPVAGHFGLRGQGSRQVPVAWS